MSDASLPIEAARGAGRLVDTLRGATLGELHVPLVRQRETAVGDGFSLVMCDLLRRCP